MGIVYKAFDPDIRRQVAVKTIRKPADGRTMRDGRQSMAARFRQRGPGRWAGLAHPGIVGVYEYGEDQQVRVYRDGVRRGAAACVSTFTRRARSPTPTIPSLMNQLLDALGHAHQQKRVAPRHQAGQLDRVSTGRG
jgi:eukaryotic-like serine/threonine-protein kinase